MTAAREALADRVRAALPADRPVREVSMFGGLSFMVAGSMVVAAGRDGDLLVRTDPARHAELLDVVGAEPAVMGADRPMGPGWVRVGRDGLADDAQLAFWVQVGLDHLDHGRSRPAG
ncbi:TfoX/Sxy family protein [Friedmanniella luteola]|nr:TfoX/Sxy family protein [Friedmanniella luteola]